ncbi:MAG: excinuclease ATPase subunit [Stenotrophobium sp.]
MNKQAVLATLALGFGLGLALAAPVTYARDDVQQMSIADAMNSADAKDQLDGSVKFYWSTQSHPAVVQKYGTFTSNKKTSFFGKSAEAGCARAFLSAMIAMQARAVHEGGNAVIDLHSVYKGHEFESATQYECGAGAIMGGTALRGTVVKIK